MKAEHPSQLLYPGKGLWSSFFPLWRVLIPRTFKSHYFDKNGKEVIDKVRRLIDHSLVSRPFLWRNETRSIGHLDKGRGWRIPTTSQETKSDNYTELFYSIQKQQHKHMALSKLMRGEAKIPLTCLSWILFPNALHCVAGSYQLLLPGWGVGGTRLAGRGQPLQRTIVSPRHLQSDLWSYKH